MFENSGTRSVNVRAYIDRRSRWSRSSGGSHQNYDTGWYHQSWSSPTFKVKKKEWGEWVKPNKEKGRKTNGDVLVPTNDNASPATCSKNCIAEEVNDTYEVGQGLVSVS